jgi:hypothetical protein
VSDYNPAQDTREGYEVGIAEIRRRKIAAGEIVPDYHEFLAQKVRIAPPVGFEPLASLMPAAIKPFQRDIVTWACRRGRAAVFAGTGLGKTIQELTWAQQVCAHTGGRVLLFTPLAVAEQTVAEAVKFGVEGVSYAKDEASAHSPIVVTNYDRRQHFDPDDFAGVVLDESGIIKDHDSRTRMDLTESCRNVPYLFCGSATPAPNDWTELGQHAEFLGVMSAKEMMSMYFVHEGSVRANGEEDWRLKRHAAADFWRWVASWSVMIRHPRDLGYDDLGYDLPPLDMRQVTVKVDIRPTTDGMLFQLPASTLQERVSARRDSVSERVAEAARMVATAPGEPWLIWCNLNAEADALVKAIPGAVNVQGSDAPEVKAKRLLGFSRGEPRILVSKPSIAGRGMNWQHCNRMIFVGLNDSFEQLFQAVRRCWRFGQSKPVTAYLIASEMEGAVVANLRAKEAKYEAMAEAMVEHMRDLSTAAVRGGRVSASTYNPNQIMEVPSWLTAA